MGRDEFTEAVAAGNMCGRCYRHRNQHIALKAETAEGKEYLVLVCPSLPLFDDVRGIVAATVAAVHEAERKKAEEQTPDPRDYRTPECQHDLGVICDRCRAEFHMRYPRIRT